MRMQPVIQYTRGNAAMPPTSQELEQKYHKKAPPPPGPYRANNTKQRCSRLTYMHLAVYENPLKNCACESGLSRKKIALASGK